MKKTNVMFFSTLVAIVVWFLGTVTTVVTNSSSSITRTIFGLCLLFGVILLAIVAVRHE